MLNNILLVGLGGGLGSILRFLCQRSLNNNFPYGTLLVNLAGCFIIGLAWGYFARNMEAPSRLFLITGLCGGFTTFSAFTQEGVQMMMDNRWAVFIIYTGLSVMAGLLLTYLGFKITQA